MITLNKQLSDIFINGEQIQHTAARLLESETGGWKKWIVDINGAEIQLHKYFELGDALITMKDVEDQSYSGKVAFPSVTSLQGNGALNRL